MHIFDIISLFAAALEEPKIGISDKGLTTYKTVQSYTTQSKKKGGDWKHRNCQGNETGLFNPLPDNKLLEWSKLKQIADDILKCIQNGK